jgi:hypothetical protein
MVLARQLRGSRTPTLRGSSDNSTPGSEDKRCSTCLLQARRTKETIHNGMQLIRIRYGIPYCELPDCNPSDLSSYLSFLLLQGKVRDPVKFPRRQVFDRSGESGLCKLQRLCRRNRWGLAHSLSSIKRNLPPGCVRHMPSQRSKWEQNAVSQPPPSSSEYLAHVRRVATRLFRPGWDKRYPDFVNQHVPNPTSRLPKRSRADHLWMGRREEFYNACMTENDQGEFGTPFIARYKEVPTAGKLRSLLIFDERIDYLAPLHRLVYSHLERTTDWLLCGPPTVDRMTSVLTHRYQTSVDLVAATDGLAHDVSETLLESLFFTSVKIPRSIRRLADASLSPLFRDGEGVLRRVRHGQMMGSYLSFPLLCLHSYCAATWATRDCESARILVNGDDTVISTDRPILVHDYPFGYRLNNDKTIRAENVAEINSTAFLHSRGKWREVRHLRRGGACADYPGMLHMAKAVLIAPEWVTAFTRARIGRRWGFLPSQLGHLTYPSYLRDRTMSRRRNFTVLPTEFKAQDETGLRRIYGRDPTPDEADNLRHLMWASGRRGGLRRDEFNPSHGRIRRSYSYRSNPARAFMSFGGWKDVYERAISSKAGFFLVSEDWETEEERLAEFKLSLWDSGLATCPGVTLEDSRVKEH